MECYGLHIVGAVFEELQVKLPDPTWSFDVRKAIVRSSVESFANSIATVAPDQLAPLFCLSTGGRSQPSTGGRVPASVYLAVVPPTIPPEGPGPGDHRVTGLNPFHRYGEDRARRGAGRQRQGSPASAPAPNHTNQASPALECPGRPQPGRPDTSGDLAPGTHGSWALSSPSSQRGQLRVGPGRLPASGNQRSPPDRSTRPRPQQRRRRLCRSHPDGVISPQCLQIPYVCRGLL
ncbi:hypothetical protein NDU88_001943 [Pleurodeles waltl]|uniref:Uncharacterized protein n=1 Tax=Pleurodeles waltl TaxID=8319 RepID=A0AAV7VDC6_PLEWA|nr:hypothetical protein NDU88_001943 [Pleurodeles waltl]